MSKVLVPVSGAQERRVVDLDRLPPALVRREVFDSRVDVRDSAGRRRVFRFAAYPFQPVLVALGLIALSATGHEVRDLRDEPCRLPVDGDRSKVVPLGLLATAVGADDSSFCHPQDAQGLAHLRVSRLENRSQCGEEHAGDGGLSPRYLRNSGQVEVRVHATWIVRAPAMPAPPS